jgi:hypothetical protein
MGYQIERRSKCRSWLLFYYFAGLAVAKFGISILADHYTQAELWLVLAI